MTLASDSIRAVLDTHADLEAWFSRKDPEALARFEATLGEDFTLVTPSGVHCDRATVIAQVRARGGGAGEDFTIRIEAAGAHVYDEELAVAVYREVQTGGSWPATVRLSTAVFSRAPSSGVTSTSAGQPRLTTGRA
jgi:hypothetical protein